MSFGETKKNSRIDKFLNKFKKAYEDENKEHIYKDFKLTDTFQGQYIVTSLNKYDNANYRGQLQYNGYYENFMSENNPVVKSLNFAITLDNNNEVTLKIAVEDFPVFELPYNKPFPHTKNYLNSDQLDTVYYLELPEINQPFNFAVRTIKNDLTIFETRNMPMVFSKFYVQVGTQVYGEEIWGWGERRSQWGYESGQYTIWNLDNPVTQSSGKVNSQTYGTHPMWLQRTSKNAFGEDRYPSQYHITFLRSTYGMELDYQKNSDMIFQLTGGNIEFKMFIYDSPEQNIEAYHEYVNGWVLHPFWASGYQITRWGLHSSQDLINVQQAAINNGLSFDSMYSDIEYLEDYADFTVNSNFNPEQMHELTNQANPQGIRWIPIIDAGISVKSEPAVEGLEKDVFIKSAAHGGALMGCVWPGASYFMDWNHPEAINYWKQGLSNITDVYQLPQIDGVWLDMNEPASFQEDQRGEVWNADECDPMIPMINGRRNLNYDGGYPWSPNGMHLEWKTISVNGYHFNGEQSEYLNIENYQITEHAMHNLYGFFQGIATNKYLKEKGFDLPYIVSRSTFAGSGAYVQHWTGDNQSSWSHLETSIGDIFNNQLYGIPMSAPDVCGFTDLPTIELCGRWYQLGAWYPFFRSHNVIDMPDQFPWSFPDFPFVLESTRSAINLRYSLLKWYYTLFVRQNGKGSVFRPLFFEFPQEEISVKESHQFLLGSEIMVAPVWHKGDWDSQLTDLTIYFPGLEYSDMWYNPDSGEVYIGGDVVTYYVPFNAVSPYFIRGGHVVFQQGQAFSSEFEGRTRFLNNRFTLKVALNRDGYADGTILGVTEDYSGSLISEKCVATPENSNNNCILNLQAKLENNKLMVHMDAKDEFTNFDGDIVVERIDLLGHRSFENLDLHFSQGGSNRYYLDL